MLSAFVLVQLIVQALSVASGIFLVRTVDHGQYALFTIANSMQSTMSLLADTGLGIGMSSIGGKVWQDRDRLGQLVATTMQLRRYLGLIAAIIVTPILAWMLIVNGASRGQAALLCSVVLVGLNFQLVTAVLMNVPRFLSQVDRIQRIDLAAAVVRAAALVCAYFIVLNASSAILAGVAAIGVQFVVVRRLAAESVDLRAAINPEFRRTLLSIVRSGIPTTVFYCIQGQATVWLMTVFSSTRGVAEIGALGRLSVIFSVIGSVMTTIVLPRFAKYQSADLLRRRYLQITGAFVVFGCGLVAAAALMPNAFLWILGNKYALLQRELVLMMVQTAVTTIAGTMWSLNAAKAWIKHAWVYIPATLILQAILLGVLDVSTLNGVLWFGIFSQLPSALLNIGLFAAGLRSARRGA